MARTRSVMSSIVALPCRCNKSEAIQRASWESSHLFELGSQQRLDISLLLEDEAGQQSHDLFRLVVGEGVFEDQLGQNELIGRIDLSMIVSM